MKEIIRIVLLVVLIAGTTFAASKFIMSFKKLPEINELVESIKLVKIRTVKLDTNILSIPIYGNLKSLNEIDIFPEVGGRLMNDDFREGNSYSKGDVIAVFDNNELASNIKSQKSNLLNQTAKLVADMKFDFPEVVNDWETFLNNIDFNARLPELPKISNLKQKKYLAGKSIYSTYFSIQAQEDRLAKYTVIAPFDGTLIEALLKPGTVARAGQKMGKFINSSQFELEANVTLANGSRVKVGDKVILQSNDIDGEWEGTIKRINRTLSEASQNMAVFILINSSSLYNGMYLFGEAYLGSANNSIMVNRSLLDGDQIFIIEEGVLKARKISILQINEEVAIISGLENGDIILSEAINGSFEGMKVRYN